MILTKSILEHWWTTGINLLIGLYVLTMFMIPVADGGEHRLSHPNVRNRNYGYVNYWIGHYRVDIRPWQAELLCNSWWYSASSQNNDTSNFWKYIQDVAVFRDHPREHVRLIMNNCCMYNRMHYSSCITDEINRTLYGNASKFYLPWSHALGVFIFLIFTDLQ